MKQALEYRGETILETDEGPVGHPDGTWLLFRSAAGWQVLYAGEPGVVYAHGEIEATASRDDAWNALRRHIDESVMFRATMNKAEDFVPEVLQHKVNQTVQDGGFALQAPVSRSKATLGMELLIKLHNGLGADDPLRGEMRAQLQADAKENWQVAGLMVLPSGDLSYDQQRALVAVHRRKLARRVEAVQTHLEELAADLHAVLGTAAEENTCLATIGDTGAPLVSLVPLTAATRALTSAELPLLDALTGIAKQAREHDPIRSEPPALPVKHGQ